MNKNYYVMLHDEKRCIGCQSCTVACKMVNQVPGEYYRLQVHVGNDKTTSETPELHFQFFRTSCQHCEDAPCITVCPTKASYCDENGIVQVDKSKCIGCNYCIAACPYHVRFINPITKVAEKCDFCSETRLSQGLEPACVTVCPTDALIFGRSDDSAVKTWIDEKKPYSYQLEGVGKPHLYRRKETHKKEPSNG